eukprot:2590688-Alexandrium_andersonii.AAC.1
MSHLVRLVVFATLTWAARRACACSRASPLRGIFGQGNGQARAVWALSNICGARSALAKDVSTLHVVGLLGLSATPCAVGRRRAVSGKERP